MLEGDPILEASQPEQAKAGGFSLILALLTTTLITSLLLMLHLQIAARWDLVNSVDAQLDSFTLAESGIERARTLIPTVDLDLLLKGMDGTHSGTGMPEWRNPLPLGKARTIEPDSRAPERDDGIPFQNASAGLPGGGSDAGKGYFLLRFSNNPEEDPSHDEDQVILVRSLGITALPLPDPLLPDIRNSITLIEARFRKETTFLLPSPLTLFGDSGNFEWNGSDFQVAGNTEHGISIIEATTPGLYRNLVTSLAPAQRSQVRGQGSHPSISEIGSAYSSHPVYRRLFEPRFWTHFEKELPRFSADPAGGILLLPQGGTITDRFEGILVAREDLILGEGALIRGLLIHLGGGRLVLRDNSQVEGGIWMSNLLPEENQLTARPLNLSLSGEAAITYSLEAIQSGLSHFPPTQLGWRLLFPEMDN